MAATVIKGHSQGKEENHPYVLKYRGKYLQPKDEEGVRIAGDLWENQHAFQNYSSKKKIYAAAGVTLFCLSLLFKERIIENPAYLWGIVVTIPSTVIGYFNADERADEHKSVGREVKQELKCRDGQRSGWDHFQPTRKESLKDAFCSRLVDIYKGCECVARMLFKGVEKGPSCSLCSRSIRHLP